jgi:hypothetical protein
MFVPMRSERESRAADFTHASAGFAAGSGLALLDLIALPEADLAGFHLLNLLVLGSAGTLAGELLALLGQLTRSLAQRLAAGKRKQEAREHFIQALLVAFGATLFLSLPLTTLFEGRWVSGTWLGTTGPSLAALAALIGVFVWTQAYLYFRSHKGPRRGVAAGLAIAVGTSLGWAHRGWVPGLYLPFHDLATWLAFCLAWTGVLLAMPTHVTRRRIFPAVNIIIVLLSSTALCGLSFVHLSDPGHRAQVWQKQMAVESLARNVRRLADLDGDAVSRLFGGGDCDDLSAHVHPFRLDIPENGIDEDCDGHDLSVAAASQALAAWVPPEPERLATRAAYSKPANVLVISIDALRHDYAFDKQGSPLLASLRMLQPHLTVFRRAYAPATTTQLSVPAIWTSRYRYWEAQGSVPRDFAGTGYKTALFSHVAFVSHLAHPGEGEYPAFDCARHFGHVGTVGEARRKEEWGMGADSITAAQLSGETLAWWAETKGPKFAWVHYFDLHQWNVVKETAHLDSPADKYRLVLENVDKAATRLLEALASAGELERTVVVFTADHGEGLGDRGILYHTKLTYDVLSRVPLAIYLPGRAPSLHHHPVSLTDLRPTLAELVAARTERVEGVSVAAALASDAPWHRPGPILISDLYQQGVVLGEWKIIFDRFSHVAQLYNLATDPLETRNIAEGHPDVLSRLSLLLKANPNYLQPTGSAVSGPGQ